MNNVVVAVIMAVAGAIVYLFLDVLIRRLIARIRSREDYDEDVDNTMTKAEKKKAEEMKVVEAEKKKAGFKDAKNDNPVRFWAVIIIGVLLSAFTGFWFGFDLKTVLYFLFFGLIVTIAFVDLDTMEIPPELNYIILGLGIIAIWIVPEITIVERIIGALCVSGFMLILTLIIRGAFGFGDIKMMFAAGFLLGWKMTLAGFLIGVFVGAAAGIIVIASKKKSGKEHLPFGPSLCVGMIISVFVGMNIFNWYADLIRSAMPSRY
jgi:leader peptidase (prepilin peptidase)/N-methyltransferase